MPSRIKSIIILIETPLRERDYKRFGLEILSKNFQVLVLDFTALIRPQFWEEFKSIRYDFPGYRSICTFKELFAIIANLKGRSIAIDYLFFGKTQTSVRKICRDHQILLTAVLAGLIPTNPLGRDGRGKFLMRTVRDFIFKNYCSLRASISQYIKPPEYIADISLLAGTHAYSLPRSRTPHQIIGHSLDYDTFLDFRNKPPTSGNYVVFLDQDLVGHTDRLITGTPAFVTAGNYFDSMNKLFTQIEMQFGMPVIIASQPKSLYSANHPFALRTIATNNTANLVRNAQLVLGHYSTAISFAVLWKKPIFLITTHELKKSWVQQYWIDAFQQELGIPLIDADSPLDTLPALPEKPSIDTAYLRYQEKYIKTSNTPDLPLWEIFSNAIMQLPPLKSIAHGTC